MLSGPAGAQDAGASNKIAWVPLVMGAVGGLALFLYGVDILAGSLKQAQGGRFEKLLKRSSSNRLLAFEVRKRVLHAKIGELTLANDFLAGALGKAGLLPSAKR